MEFSTSSSTLTVIVLVTVTCLSNIRETCAQMQASVMALEATAVDLTIVIPNNQLANSASYITIRHDRGNGQNITDVLYSMQGTLSITDAYGSKLTADQIDKRLTLRFQNIAATDAGTFKCYTQASLVAIADCGQLLIIIRKPNPPTVKILPSSNVVVGSRLELLCETHTTSLPPNHGLASEIWWYDQSGQTVRTSQRIGVSAQGQLVIQPLERADKSLKFYCISADNAGDISKRLTSDQSALYEVNPEYKPAPQDFKLTPSFQNDETIDKVIGERLSYRCEVECWPQCDIIWMFNPVSSSTEFRELPPSTEKNVLTFANVSRTNEGFYQCKAENKHGFLTQGFKLAVLYLEAPTININGEDKNIVTFVEDTPVSLTCVFDSNPGPVVNWVTPSGSTLFTQRAPGPNLKGEGGVNKYLYNSTFSTTQLKCENAGEFRCDGTNTIRSGEGRMKLEITCPPSNFPGLGLQQEYVWEISHALDFQFVIRAYPEPDITQIVSSLNGVSRKEEIPVDVYIAKSPKYNEQIYLTHFAFTSKRVLNQNDADRIYTMTIQSSEFKKDFVFQIHPRGPPHEVINLTAIDIGHDSVKLFWLPGFNGGSAQSFTVEQHVRSSSEQETGVSQQLEDNNWFIAFEKLADASSGNWIEVIVRSLSSSTDYIFRVKAINTLGSSVSTIRVRTTAKTESLGAGAIVGIVIAVIIILVIIAVALYFFVYKKRFGSSRGRNGQTKKSFMPEKIRSLFTRNTSNAGTHAAGRAGGVEPNGSGPKEGHWAKAKKLLRSNSRNSLDYVNVPPKDYIEDSQSNEFALNNNALGPQTPEFRRKMNDEGLVYVEVDFPEGNKKTKKAKDKKKKKKDDPRKNNDGTSYSDIDFSKTAAMRAEIEEAEAAEEEEHLNVYENASSQNKYADAGYGIGTTV